MFSYFSALVLFGALIFGESKPYYMENNERVMGDACELRNGKQGTCQELISCEPAKLLFDQRKIDDIELCSFNGIRPLVCCPKMEFRKIQRRRKTSGTKFEKALCKNVEKSVQISDHIINGQKAGIAEFPFQAALGYLNKETNNIDFNCGGTLIADDIVLTAAHCVNMKNQPIKVRLGRTTLDMDDEDDDSEKQDIEIEKIVIHTGYKRNIRQNDIALIKLKHPAVLSYNVKTICLSTKHNQIPKEFTIIGFGSTGNTDHQKSNWLLKGTVKEYPFEICRALYAVGNKKIARSQFCAIGDSNEDTCPGDSGGPLFYKSNDLIYQHGITSYGSKCGGNFPGVYTKVSEFLGWIEIEMNKLE